MDDRTRKDLVENINLASEILSTEEAGSEARKTEVDIYNSHLKMLMQQEELDMKREFEQIRLVQEKRNADAELSLKQRESNISNATSIIRCVLGGVALGLDAWMGIIFLKANMKYGGMMGKDSKKWFDDIKRIKL